MKYYEVNTIGTGRQDDPYRPDLPVGVPFVCADGSEAGGKGASGGKMEKDAEGNDIGPFDRVGGKMLVGLPEEWDEVDPNTQVKTRKKLSSVQINGTKLKLQDELTAQQRAAVQAFLREADPIKKAAAKATLPADSVARKAADFGWDEATVKTWRIG